MCRLINVQDFKGFYNISQNCYDKKDLESYIDTFQQEFLCKLLGNQLANELMAELEAKNCVLPLNSPYQYLFDKKCIGCGSCCGCGCDEQGFYIGLKEVLLGLFYYEYIVQQAHQNTITGFVNGQNETSSKVSNLNVVRLAEQRYNRSVLSIEALQSSIIPSTYKGYCKFKVKHYPFL